MTQPELEVVWAGGNSFNLLGENETAYGDVLCEALGEGTEWGNIESIRRTLHRALAAGSALAKDGVENRTVTVRLRLSAADARALAGGEAVLHMLDEQRRVELHWTQPDDYAVSVAFIAVAVDLRRDYNTTWDTDENLVRQTWTLTFTCLPHVRSIEAVSVEALPEFIALPTVLNDCTSTVGWSVPYSFTVATSGGAIEMETAATSGTSVSSGGSLTMTFTPTKRYLAIESQAGTGDFRWGLDDLEVYAPSWLPLALVGVEGAWHFYDMDAVPAGNAITRIIFPRLAWTAPGVVASVLTIGETDTPSTSAGRQSLRIIPTPGSARADGSLAVESRNATTDGSGDALGTVIVYTGPDYDPRLSPHSDGTRTADTTALSGSKETGSSWSFTRPPNSVPQGSYSVWVNAKGTASETATWGAIFGGAAPGVPDYLTVTSLSGSHTFDGTDYNLFNLGTIDLPGIDIGVLSGLDLRVYMTKSGAAADVDEVLLFNRSTGRLTVVDTSGAERLEESGGVWSVTPSGGATRLWLDAASLDGNERILAGSPSKEMSLPLNLTDEIIAYDGTPAFTPDNTYVYVATTETIDPVVTGEFRPAWHTHAAE